MRETEGGERMKQRWNEVTDVRCVSGACLLILLMVTILLTSFVVSSLTCSLVARGRMVNLGSLLRVIAPLP